MRHRHLHNAGSNSMTIFQVEDVNKTLVRWDTEGAPAYIYVVTLSRVDSEELAREGFPTPVLCQITLVGPSLNLSIGSKFDVPEFWLPQA